MSRPVSGSGSVDAVPSGVDTSHSSNGGISSQSNGYAGSSNTSYATITATTGASVSSYVSYTFSVTGIPSGATITSVTCSVKGRVSSTNYLPTAVHQLYAGGTAKGSTTSFASTTASARSVNGGSSWTLSEIANIQIRSTVTRGTSSTTRSANFRFYGASLTVSYTYSGTEYEITVSNSTSATIGYEQWVPEGEDTTVTTDTLTNITVTDNGVDVTSQFVAHYPDTTASTDLGSFTLVSGGFNSGQSWFEGIEGNGADTTETTTSNYYSSGSGTIAVFTYDMGITIPSNAEVTRLYCRVSGHAESTSQGSEYMCAQLISGSVDLTEELNFKNVGTSNSIQTLEATTLPTVAQLAAMKLQCRLGYYGGAINGATAYVEYEVPGSSVDHYEYTITNVTADHAIVVTSGGTTTALYVKQNGSWVQVSRAYKKTNGTWTQVAVDQAFQSGVKYVKG